MQIALQLAADAAAAGEVPVGAVVVRGGQVIGSGHNSPIQSCDPTAHAEMNALRAAANATGNYRLDDCTLYVTLEPCAMCSGAMLHSRLQRVVFGAAEPKTGCAGSVMNLFADRRLNHHTEVLGGVLAPQAIHQLQGFFQTRRSQQREQAWPLREDALRTPEACFEGLAGYPWRSSYVSHLSSLAGLRLHYLDLGPTDARPCYVCLHPIPGWSYQWHQQIEQWLGQGARVLAPDLIGFGKSDKPKRQDFHTLAWHLRYLCEWMEWLDLQDITLVAPDASHVLLQGLGGDGGLRVTGLLLLPTDVPKGQAQQGAPLRQALQAPYPDAGHRAAERAFAGFAAHQAKMQP